MRILVVSPIASHPQNQGNSARIFSMCKGLQALGHLVHYLYYPMEGLTPRQREDMASCWDGFHSIPCNVQIPAPVAGAGYGIDDWYDPALGACAAALHRQWQFDAVIVNYVWISGTLEALPADLTKIIDTHDVFGDRHKTFESVGLKPEWYYTTRAEELRALRRADIVIAIQSLEAEHFRGMLGASATRVATVGYGVPTHYLPHHHMTERPVVGYLGSGNPFNTLSIRQFVKELGSVPGLAERFRFVLAGTICGRFATAPGPFELLGSVDDLQDFYAGIDIALNPMLGGTGLKIKTLEGLSFGLPVLGTADAWVGISTPEEVWPTPAAPSTIEALSALAADPQLIAMLRKRCRTVYREYLANQLQTISDLFTLECLSYRPRDRQLQ